MLKAVVPEDRENWDGTHASGLGNCVDDDWGFSRRSLKKLEIELPYDPAIPLLGIYPGKTVIQKDTRTPMLTAALFTTARTGNSLNAH